MPLLVRSEPYRDMDRLLQQLLVDPARRGTALGMPMDAYRKEDQFLLQFDLPGVSSSSIELTVDNNTLTVKAERQAPSLRRGGGPRRRTAPWHVHSSHSFGRRVGREPHRRELQRRSPDLNDPGRRGGEATSH